MTMLLGDLCKNIMDVPPEWKNILIRGLAYDSRNIRPGDLFVAISGIKQNGADFAAEAVREGAVAVISEKLLAVSVPCLLTQNSRQSLAFLSDRFYGDLSRKLKVVGITGTNGKTTTAFLIESIFKQAGLNPGLMGTVLYRWCSQVRSASRTTPESNEIHSLMRDMSRDGVDAVIMEVSSHALSLDRVLGMVFRAAVFTNLTQDHLDYHGTFDAYAKSKMKLFRMVAPDGVVVINADDPYGKEMIEASSARAVTFGLENASSDYRIREVRSSEKETHFVLGHPKKNIALSTRLWGNFNVMNTAAAAICSLELGLDESAVREGIFKMDRVPGRMEGFSSSLGFRIVVDYAHTPDALQNVLATVRKFTRGRVLVVFGCGGDRDKSKRPIMGGIAARLADQVIVTSDNPRSENPEAIINDILNGMKDFQNVETLINREQAIEKAMKEAREGDTVVIAGKGHETYQEIDGKRFAFDDRQIVAAHIKRMTEI